MIDLKRNRIVRREIWFDQEWSPKGADLMVFYHWSSPVNAAGAVDVNSLEIDLTCGEEKIWKNFTSTARNLINRGTKEGLSVQTWTDPSPAAIEEFFAFQRRFAQERNNEYRDPVWMFEYAKQGSLLLTVSRGPDLQPLVWHSYYRSPRWVRLLHSVSLIGSGDPEQRKMIGWANRYLHWMDIRDCKARGIERYDFGGWYAGEADEKLLGINAFKEQFGGVRTVRYHSMLPVSLKGKLFLLARKAIKKDSSLVHFV